MIDNNLKEKIKNIIAKQLGIKKQDLKENYFFVKDLGADSLDTVEIIMNIEDELNIEIDDEAAEKIQTLKDIYQYINKTIH